MRRLLPLAVLAAILSLAATFGGPEEIDPKAAPETLGYGTVDQIGVDGNGRAYWLTERDTTKALVLERCGGGWQTALETGKDPVIQDLAVAPSGAAVAVWFEDSEQQLWSAYRSPGGSWATALVTSGQQMYGADAAIDGNGDVVLAWAGRGDDKVSGSFRHAATGAWEAPTPLTGGFGNPRVAIFGGSAIAIAADAKLVQSKIVAFPRPWGGGPETAVDYDELRGGPWLEYDPSSGQPVVLFSQQTATRYRTLQAAVRGGPTWSMPAEIDHTDFPAQLLPQALARHPQGLVAAYRRTDAMAVSRFGAGWSSPTTFAGTFEDVTVAAGGDGEIVVAGSKDNGEIWAATAPSLGSGFSGLTRLSAAGPGWRFPVAAGGGGRLVVAWGDHRGGQQRTLAAVSGACTDTAAPQPTATATPAPQPPPPPAGPQPQPKPKVVTIADVVTLPSAKKCRDSLKLKFRKPAKKVAMTVNGKKVKVKVGKAVTIKLRKRTTLKITVTLADGKKLKSTARFRPC
jgi:hypothetical protein